MELPADSHVHSQWSWDARLIGAMDATCARAVAVGLPAVAFTEHVDFTPFRAGSLVGHFPEMEDFVADGILTAPALDVDGYLECIDRCRVAHPGLTIVTGVEVGQPHLHTSQVNDLLSRGQFDRVLGSLHCLPDGDSFAEPWELFTRHSPTDVFRDYLAEIPRMVMASEAATCSPGPGRRTACPRDQYPPAPGPGDTALVGSRRRSAGYFRERCASAGRRGAWLVRGQDAGAVTRLRT